MDEMMKAISKYVNGTYLRVEWDNGQLVLEGKIDTIYESDNGLEMEEDGYKEFYACAFRVEVNYSQVSRHIFSRNFRGAFT